MPWDVPVPGDMGGAGLSVHRPGVPSQLASGRLLWVWPSALLLLHLLTPFTPTQTSTSVRKVALSVGPARCASTPVAATSVWTRPVPPPTGRAPAPGKGQGQVSARLLWGQSPRASGSHPVRTPGQTVSHMHGHQGAGTLALHPAPPRQALAWSSGQRLEGERAHHKRAAAPPMHAQPEAHPRPARGHATTRTLPSRHSGPQALMKWHRDRRTLGSGTAAAGKVSWGG